MSEECLPVYLFTSVIIFKNLVQLMHMLILISIKSDAIACFVESQFCQEQKILVFAYKFIRIVIAIFLVKIM